MCKVFVEEMVLTEVYSIIGKMLVPLGWYPSCLTPHFPYDSNQNVMHVINLIVLPSAINVGKIMLKSFVATTQCFGEIYSTSHHSKDRETGHLKYTLRNVCQVFVSFLIGDACGSLLNNVEFMNRLICPHTCYYV